MRLAAIGSRLLALASAFGHRLAPVRSKETGAHERRDGRLRFKAPPRRYKLRLHGERGIRGPAFIPERGTGRISRQQLRHGLRALCFAGVSRAYPNFTRRTRRAWSRTAAKVEYLKMMKERATPKLP